MARMALEGVKVLDFTWWGAGPFATKCLADFGATVVKVESRKHPDLIRLSEPFKNDEVGYNTSGSFITTSTSKYGLALDLTNPKGVEVAKRLVTWCDVVMENYAPGVMHGFGLDYGELVKIKPDVIMLSSSALGQKGVYSGIRGHALVSAALGGHLHLTGYPEGGPLVSTSVQHADIIQPLYSVVAILAALDYRRRTGQGQFIDNAQFESMVQHIAPAMLDYAVNGRDMARQGNRHPQAAPHGAFPCQGEDQWIAIAVFTDEEWEGLCRAMGNPAWAREDRFATPTARKENEDTLERLVGAWTQRYSAEEAMARLQREGVPSGVLQDPSDIVDRDPQARARELFVPLEHPVIGQCLHPSQPVKLSRTPARLRTAPLLGEHTELVCIQFLGMSQEEYSQLLAEGVFE